MNNLLILLGNLFVFFARLVSDYRRDKEKHDAENRIAAVRADPASAWLRKLGGTDRRFPASGSDDATVEAEGVDDDDDKDNK